MNTAVVVINLERFRLSRKIARIPEKHVIEILAANGSDETFHKRIGDRHMRNRLNLVDFEHAQVGKSAMKTKDVLALHQLIFQAGRSGGGIGGRLLAQSVEVPR